MRIRIVGMVSCIAIATGAIQAQAQTYEQHEHACFDGRATAVQKIENCSAVIASGRRSGERLVAAFLVRGLAHFSVRRFDEAERDLEHEARFARGNDLYRQASALLAGAVYDRTIEALDQAIQSSPNDATAFYGRARARQVFHKAFIEPGSQDVRDFLGAAIRDFDQAIRLNPGFVEAFFHRGRARLERRQLDEAIGDFTEVVRLDSRRDDAFASRGVAYGLRSQEALAMADCNEALRLNPDNVAALAQRGFALYRRGEFEKAIHDLDRAVALDPTDIDASSNRARVAATIEHRTRLDEAIRKNPKDATAFFNRGRNHASWRQHRAAIRDFDEALGLERTYAEAYAERGESYRALGDYDRAIQDFDQAIRLKPRDFTFRSKRDWAVQEKARAGK